MPHCRLGRESFGLCLKAPHIMRVLLIDNTSRHIKELAGLFGDNILTVVPYGSVDEYDAASYDLIVLSGGRAHPLMGNSHIFNKEIKLVSQTHIPVIGICFGFQLLAYIHNAEIRRLKKKIQGFHAVEIVDSSLEKKLGKHILVYEGHSWSVPHVPEHLAPLIISSTGIEAFKHKQKPHYGLQFHPEMTHGSDEGKQVFEYILSQIAF